MLALTRTAALALWLPRTAKQEVLNALEIARTGGNGVTPRSRSAASELTRGVYYRSHYVAGSAPLLDPSGLYLGPERRIRQRRKADRRMRDDPLKAPPTRRGPAVQRRSRYDRRKPPLRPS